MTAQATTEHNTKKKIPVGIWDVPLQHEPLYWQFAKDIGLSFMRRGINPEKGPERAWVFPPKPEEFKRDLKKVKELGFVVSLTNDTVHMDHAHLPDRYCGKTFNDPAVLAGYEQFLTKFLTEFGDCMDFFNLSNEINLYFGSHQNELPAYLEMVAHGAAVVRRLRPHIKIGVITTAEAATEYWAKLEPICDYLACTYYAPNSALQARGAAAGLDPNDDLYFAMTLDRVLEVAGKKPALITEIGCATDPRIATSPELQAEFIRALFAWLRGKEDKILGLSWLSLHDWSEEWLIQTLTGLLSDQLLASEPMMAYLSSLGLTGADGAPKLGFEVFRDELRRYVQD